MVRGLINKILTHSAVDGPGNRMVFFLQGCNFSCHYCHNPETINPCKEAYSLTVAEALKRVSGVAHFISGITISGGEPTLQPEFVREVFSGVKDLGLTTFLDTNASSLANLKVIVPVLDGAMVDVKTVDAQEHQKLVGTSNDDVFLSLEYLADQDKLYEVRTVILPGVFDNYRTVDSVSKFLSNRNPAIRYKLIRFRKKGVRSPYHRYSEPDDELMRCLAKLASANGCRVILV